MATALDVWLKFDEDDLEEAAYEANTFKVTDGYVVKWYHTAVGQVSSKSFDTYEEAQAWLERENFQDFSS